MKKNFKRIIAAACAAVLAAGCMAGCGGGSGSRPYCHESSIIADGRKYKKNLRKMIRLPGNAKWRTL